MSFPNRFERWNTLQTLDPQRDNQEIVRLTGMYEFPWLTQRALEFALFRTYAVPQSSALLDRTAEFYTHGQKRYDDTTLLIAEFGEHGYESERGRAAIKRMNQMHRRYSSITNEEFLYVLSVFVFEPIRWNRRFGWRPGSRTEDLANYYFWVEVGKRMGIKDIPTTIEAFEAYNRQYERENFRYADSNRRVGDATLQIFLDWYPAPLRPMLRRCLYALMDKPLLDAMGYPEQPRWLQRMVTLAMQTRAALIRHFMPPRSKPYSLTEKRTRSYPQGYEIERLGAHQVMKAEEVRAIQEQ